MYAGTGAGCIQLGRGFCCHTSISCIRLGLPGLCSWQSSQPSGECSAPALAVCIHGFSLQLQIAALKPESPVITSQHGLQQGVIEADIAINTFAAPEDRERIRIAVTETGVIDWRDK